MGKRECPQCKAVEFKLIPAGISKKTGKPYDEFEKCGACNYSPPKWMPKPPLAERVENLRGENIAKAQDRKEESINKFNSLNSAISLVSHHPYFQTMTHDELLDAIFGLQKKFYDHNSVPFL